MLHFPLYFQKRDISKASKGFNKELRVNHCLNTHIPSMDEGETCFQCLFMPVMHIFAWTVVEWIPVL